MPRQSASGTRGGHAKRIWVVAVACLLIVGGWLTPSLLWTSTGQAWNGTVASAVAPLADGVWHVMRGGLAYLAIPALLLVCAFALWVAFRNGPRRDAWAAVMLLVGANGTVQALKHPVLPFISGPAGTGSNLSGHVAVAAATCLVVLIPVPRRPHRLAIWCAWAFLSALSIAILLSRWHTLAEVLVPMFICGGWGVAAFAAVGATSRSRHLAGMPASQRAGQPGTPAVLACGGAVVMALVGMAAWMGAVGAGTATGVAGVLAASFVLIAGAAAMTVGLVSAFLPVQAACNAVTADVRYKPVTGGPETAELHPVTEDNGSPLRPRKRTRPCRSRRARRLPDGPAARPAVRSESVPLRFDQGTAAHEWSR